MPAHVIQTPAPPADAGKRRSPGGWRLAIGLAAAVVLLTARAAHDAQPDVAAARGAGDQPRAVAQNAALVDRVDQACRTTNPFVAVAVQARGVTSATNAAAPVIVAVRDAAPGYEPERVVLATMGQIGSVYGLAYDPAGHALFAAASLRRGAAFGPGGPGGIYRLDLTTGGLTVWAVLTAGTDPHAGDLAADPSRDDSAAAASVGKIGLGDIALSSDGAALHVVNLGDRNIYTLSLADGKTIGRFRDRVRRDQFDKALHPFALAAVGGDVLYSVTDGFDPDYPPRPKAALVYAAKPDGSNPRTVGYADWTYARTPAWSPWEDKPAAIDQPYLVGLAARPNGALVFGWRDRTVDMAPDRVLGADPDGPSTGDLRATRYQGVTWRSVDTPAFDVAGAGGQNAAFGAVAMIPGLDVVVAPTLALRGTDEVGPSAIGLAWYDAGSMRRIGTEPVFDLAGVPGMTQDLAAGDGRSCAPPPRTPTSTSSARPPPRAGGHRDERRGETAAANARSLTATAAPTVRRHRTAHAPTRSPAPRDARATATAMPDVRGDRDAPAGRPDRGGRHRHRRLGARATAGPAARLVSTPMPTR
ncbi:MAG: hypothetical protein U0470_06005 [Anaerolineae bacterium]